MNPLFFALFERLVRKQKLKAAAFISLALVVIGSIWLFRLGNPDAGDPHLGAARFGRFGDVLCFLSMILFVLYLIVSQAYSASVPHVTYIHIIYLWGGLLTLPFAFLQGGFSGIDFSDSGSILALIGLALIPTLVGHTSTNFAVRHFSTLTVSFFTLFEPFFATTAAALLLDEALDIGRVPAYLLFFLATVLYLVFRFKGSSKTR